MRTVGPNEMVPRGLRRSHGIWRLGLGLVAASGLLLVFTGCASGPQFTELLWPPPPLTSRIKFVGHLRNQDDLGKEAGELLVEALVGTRAAPASLKNPMGIVASRDGNRLYVTDPAQAAVFVFDFEARQVRFLGGPTLQFENPFGVAVDAADNVYVVDATQRVIHVLSPTNELLTEIKHKSLERPTGIAIDTERGRMYVADSSFRMSMNHVVHVFDLDGSYLNKFGGKGFEPGKLYFPTFVAVDGTGNVYVSDTLNSRVQVFDPEGQYLRTFGERGDTLGTFHKPKGVALDTFGNLYVVDSMWSNVQIFNQRKAYLLYFAGQGKIPGLLTNPTGIAIDNQNRIYVGDLWNGRVNIYQLINTTAEDSFAQPSRTEKGGDAAKETKEENGETKERTQKQANSNERR
jgi:DNA-binding beta-propeller fold protein YncE